MYFCPTPAAETQNQDIIHIELCATAALVI
jgi:hypothetical protein